MKCEICSKYNATTHIRSVINGKVTEVNLCGYCAANKNISSFGKLGLMDMLAKAFNETDLLQNGDTEIMQCPSCGSSFGDIASKGLIGCPDCYKVFYKKLMPTISRIHGNAVHTGKIPYSSAPRLETKTQIESLKKQMKEAVDTENFELAATLRDRIKSLEESKND